MGLLKFISYSANNSYNSRNNVVMVIKMKERYLNEAKIATIMIVGECPGRQRKKDVVDYVFHGNRTGDFIEELVKDYDDLVLTNVINYYDGSDLFKDGYYLYKGIEELDQLIKATNPKVIICLGRKASKYLPKNNAKVYHVHHPSFILRFNKDKDAYKETIIKVLNKKLT